MYARAPAGASHSTKRPNGIARIHIAIAAVVLSSAIGIDAAITSLDTKTGAVQLGYRPVHIDPLTPEAEGGISLKKIAPKARVY